MAREILEKAYEPGEVEARWYRYWEEEGLFKGEAPSTRTPFCIVIPPPNVTGTLHMGHALNNTLQDILCRYRRMQGHNVLWQPGTDHAGIATQNVVEKDLAAKGLDRHQVGRDRFIERVWEWREKYGGIIINQLKRLGCSCDWSRERFTMDEGLSKAVREVFVRLHEEGLIYRADYITNWCPRCHTALADLEVEHEEMSSFLYHIRYPFEKGGGYLTVATTRPETLLGDTAVAVNPEDPRFAGLSGKRVLLPILQRPIPVILDRYVDMAFGTGALKITPAHDPNDFQIGDAHGLERIKVIDEAGLMNTDAGPYAGMDRFACREAILKDLEEKELLEKVEPYRNAIGHCYRCKTMIEPLLSKQWFVRVGPLAEKALEAVRTGDTRILPPQWEPVYEDWMTHIKDWCVSRQIWWGHRIPAWYCRACGEVAVARTRPETCKACGGVSWDQETDVLDTWFSSALWPFSTLGWPDRTPELATFYPTQVLITGFDILFFWVARMMMMGIHFAGDIPFRDVYIHALVRDAEGKKMSKSKGNVIDPLVVMDRFGTDAFRFTLSALAAQGRDIKLSEERILGYRNFVNKIWNAARFVFMHLEEEGPEHLPGASPALHDRWILARLGEVAEGVTRALDEYRFNDAASLCYQFVWHEFCDWYLEMAKEALYGQDPLQKAACRRTLRNAFSAILRFLHPFMPFVTEELWQKLDPDAGSIMKAPFPRAADYPASPDVLTGMALLQGIVTAIRNIRGEMNIPPSRNVTALLDVPDPGDRRFLEEHQCHVKTLAKVETLEIGTGLPKPKASATGIFEQTTVHVVLKGLIDFAEEARRLSKGIEKAEKELQGHRKKLENPQFLQKAPEDVVAEVTQDALAVETRMTRLKNTLALIEALAGA